MGKTFTNFFREFSNINEQYIEPQHYNYTVMLQNTNTYEVYTLYGEDLIWDGDGCSWVIP